MSVVKIITRKEIEEILPALDLVPAVEAAFVAYSQGAAVVPPVGELLLDEGERKLEPFDVVVQQGTNHAWVNKGSEPALLAGVLVDAEIE